MTLSGNQLVRTSATGERPEETVPVDRLLNACLTWIGMELGGVPAALHPTADPVP